MEIVLNTSSQSERELPIRGHDRSQDQLARPNSKGRRANSIQGSLQSSEKPTSQSSEALAKEEIEERIEQMSRVKVRVAGLGLLLVIFGVLFAYGFGSNIGTGYYSAEQNFLVGGTLLLSLVFVVVGFGLFLSYYSESAFSAIFTVLFVVSLTVILSPLLQKLWLNIFLNGFKDGLTSPAPGYQVVFNSNTASQVSINYGNLKLSVCCAISQLLVYVAVVGRMQVYKTIVVAILFTVFWSLNYFLCLALLKLAPDSRFFDDYAISMVYVFGGCVALLASLDVPSDLHLKKGHHPKAYPKICSLLGIFFIWLSFCCTNSITGTKENGSTITDGVRAVFYPQGSLQMFFALSSSTISALAFSFLFNKRPRASDLFTGSISGAVLFGSVASFTTNIAVPIIVGIFSAFVSVLYKCKVMVRLNKTHARDMLGLFGSFLVVAVFGVIVLAPIVLSSFASFGLVTGPMNGASVRGDSAGWVLIYAGISAGMGLITGMVVSTVVRCCSGKEKRFGDNLVFLQRLDVVEKDLDYTEERSLHQDD